MYKHPSHIIDGQSSLAWSHMTHKHACLHHFISPRGIHIWYEGENGKHWDGQPNTKNIDERKLFRPSFTTSITAGWPNTLIQNSASHSN